MSMKKTVVRRVVRASEPIIGSSATAGVDVSNLYIDMLCERFKCRGIRRVGDDKKSKRDARAYAGLGLISEKVSPYDPKYRSLKVDGRPCMSSDDFAAYYKDLRGYKLPKYLSRDPREYGEDGPLADVQESGKSPKKALWLTVKGVIKQKMKRLASCVRMSELERLAAAWFPPDKKENRVSGRKNRMPRGVISVLAVVTLSMLLIVCSSVMVSRSFSEVSKLEYRIELLEGQRNDLYTKLEVKNDLLEIQRIAVEEYGMISGDYAASRYVDVTDGEVIQNYDASEGKDSLIVRLLKAIGFGN